MDLTQRLELVVFQIWFKELDLFWWLPDWKLLLKLWRNFFWKNMTQRIEPFFCMTQRIEPFFVWLKELNFSLNMTQRIEPFFFEYDAENWNFFSFAAKNWTFFFFAANNWAFFLGGKKQTQRIQLFFSDMTQRIEI